jgi:putative transposase
MMAERGIEADHSTLNRWVVHYASKLEKTLHQKKKRPGSRWRFDETYIKVKGEWKYYYRAVDKQGSTVDFLLTAKRDTKAAARFLNNVVEQNHRGVKRITRSMLGFKSFHCTQSTLAGIELVAMLKKGQMKKNLTGALTPTAQFYALAA